MKRHVIKPRENWQEKVEETGLLFHHTAEGLYWDESVCYEFSSKQIDELDDAANDLHKMCLNAVQFIIDNDRFQELDIPPEAVPLIKRSWTRADPTLYGRFDFAYDGVNPPKMLEYNADTPTSLLESSVTQWYWLKECFDEEADQFNSIHERLLESWAKIRARMRKNRLYLACVEDNKEDLVTVTYLQDTANQSGIEASLILIGDIGWDNTAQRFVDLDNAWIRNVFKLYPWEWLLQDQFSRNLLSVYESMCWLEPVWKMLLSNKGILPILWQLNPGHPNLLEAYCDGPGQLREFVRKPKLSREGANITMSKGGSEIHTNGTYGDAGFIYQALAPVPCIDGHYPVLGCWVIDGASAGMGIRESDRIITDNLSRFVPHLFR
ncbi:MAG: glutathionylspermidine synthase family protein [Syntrophobacteraceae bacterium]